MAPDKSGKAATLVVVSGRGGVSVSSGGRPCDDQRGGKDVGPPTFPGRFEAVPVSVTVFTAEERRALDRKWLLPRLLCLPAAVFGIRSLRLGWPGEEWLIVALLTAWTGYALFCWTSCFHECAHQTLSGRAWFDVWLGRLLGTVMLTPYTVYRESHIRHHANLNKPHDWELWPYADPACPIWFRRTFV